MYSVLTYNIGYSLPIKEEYTFTSIQYTDNECLHNVQHDILMNEISSNLISADLYANVQYMFSFYSNVLCFWNDPPFVLQKFH